ncbi:MAG: NAD-dependent epimerase/dehydratase family protein [Bacteroidota bacterium]
MVLVTGGSGLVGNEVILQLLARNKQVIAIYNRTPLADFANPNLIQKQCDILDIFRIEEIMEGIEEVYHCAATVTFNRKQKEKLFKTNIEGTANIVNAAINAGIKKMVYVSSIASLGRVKAPAFVNEEINWNETTNKSVYSKSKYLAELEVWRGIGEGLNAVIVNPSLILGPGKWDTGSSQIFKTIYDEFPWYSEGVTGFVDVRDVAKAMILLMESDITGQRFLLNAENRSYLDVFTMISKGFNKRAPYKKVTPLLAKIVWRVEAIRSLFTGMSPLVTKETTHTALAKNYFDNNKLKKYLPGFTYIKIEQTIADTCAVFLSRLNNTK